MGRRLLIIFRKSKTDEFFILIQPLIIEVDVSDLPIDQTSRSLTLIPFTTAIGSTAFNASGSIFAYSVTYDWSAGHAGNKPGSSRLLSLWSIVNLG